MIRTLPVLLMLPLTAASAQTSVVVLPDDTRLPQAQCEPTPGLVEYRPGTPVEVRPLEDMPPASRLAAVYRSLGGCPTPVVLQQGIGGEGDGDAPRPSARVQIHPAR